MNFILILQLCSVIDGQCMPAIQNEKMFNNYAECAIYGYSASAEYLNIMEHNMINEFKLSVRFWCKEIDHA